MSIIQDAIQNLKNKFKISGPTLPLEFVESAIPTIDLGKYGFSNVTQTSDGGTSSSAVAPLINRTCPQGKIRRILGAAILTTGLTNFDTGEMYLNDPGASQNIYVEYDVTKSFLVLKRPLLWLPGVTFVMRCTFTVANSFAGRLCWIEEDFGIIPAE